MTKQQTQFHNVHVQYKVDYKQHEPLATSLRLMESGYTRKLVLENWMSH